LPSLKDFLYVRLKLLGDSSAHVSTAGTTVLPHVKWCIAQSLFMATTCEIDNPTGIVVGIFNK
jgi:hypothetical protein